jgi:hypothetical protein
MDRCRPIAGHPHARAGSPGGGWRPSFVLASLAGGVLPYPDLRRTSFYERRDQRPGPFQCLFRARSPAARRCAHAGMQRVRTQPGRWTLGGHFDRLTRSSSSVGRVRSRLPAKPRSLALDSIEVPDHPGVGLAVPRDAKRITSFAPLGCCNSGAAGIDQGTPFETTGPNLFRSPLPRKRNHFVRSLFRQTSWTTFQAGPTRICNRRRWRSIPSAPCFE